MGVIDVEAAYRRWAPVYDRTFGAVTEIGRRHAVAHINAGRGSVLEVGVGTGLALAAYAPHLQVTGIDFSERMLAKARRRVRLQGLGNVPVLRQMDASALDFPDASFDTVAAMHMLSVAPDPGRVMAEIARVCKPGGQVVITNHFARETGLLGVVERISARFPNALGWHSDFRIDTVLAQTGLEVEQRRILPPLGIMTFLVLRRTG